MKPPFYRNVFSNVPHLKLDSPGNTTWEKDQAITNEEIKFLKNNKHHPFFSFMFYNGVHNSSIPPNVDPPFKPWWHTINFFRLNNTFDPTKYFNRYKDAAFYDDQLVHKVLIALKKNQLVDNTVVIITSDHGQEFNDNHKNYWGHGSNFSPYQTHVPFIVYWPGKKPALISYKTSHFDMVPTLMKAVLGVTNNPTDYSVGHSLFADKPEPFYVMGSYITTAILTNKKITTLYAGGFTRTTNLHLNPVNKGLPQPILWAAMQQMSKFYKK